MKTFPPIMPLKPTAAPRTRTANGRGSRGVSIIEALVALLVLAIGVLGALRLQLATHLAADEATRRTQAVRIAQQDLERARAFTAGARMPALANQASFDRLGATATQAVPAGDGVGAFTLERRVTTLDDGRLKAVSAQVSWVDRSGAARTVVLDSLVAGADPALGPLLLAGPTRADAFAPHQRTMAVPASAQPLGPGRSVFTPREGGTVAWVFDNASGRVVARCEAPATVPTTRLTAADLVRCESTQGLPVAGYVDFGSRTLAMPLAMAIRPAPGQAAPRHECTDDSASAAAAGRRHVAYHCLVFTTGQPQSWSGRLDIVPSGWTIGTAGAGDRRVCRFGAAAAGGNADNQHHPLIYTDVDRPLLQQNFLIVPAAQPCPTGGAGEPATQAHQP